MTTSLQRIAAAEDLFHGPAKPLSAEDWQAKCIAARTQLVRVKDLLDTEASVALAQQRTIDRLERELAKVQSMVVAKNEEIEALQDRLECLEETARAGTPPQSRPSHASDADAAQIAMVIPALQVTA